MPRCAPRLAPLVALALAAACRGDGKKADAPLSYDGATSIRRHVLVEAVPAFERRSGVRFGPLGESGGGQGLARLFAGEVTIAGVARPLTDEELAHRPHVRIIGYDVLGVFVHEGNPIQGLSKAQLKAIFTGSIVDWKDVGGPRLTIVPCTEPPRSGRSTLALLQEQVLDGAPLGPAHEAPDPADCMDFVARTPGAVTVAAVAATVPGVRRVLLDGVDATAERVRDTPYLLTRPLLLVTRDEPTGPAAAFLEFMLSAEGQAIVGKRFVTARRREGAPEP